MKKTSIALGVLIVLAFSFGSIVPQNGYDLFQKALAKERAEGNLEEAIALYQKVVQEATDESLAAKAQLRIGICYEKLGRIEARKAYEEVLEKYASQKETADEARRRLALLLKPLAAGESSELSVRRIWSGPEVMTWGALSPNGRYLSFVEDLNLCVRDLKTGKNRRLTKSGSIKSRVLAKSSVFSQDGSKIAYDWLNEDGIWDLRLIGLEDSKPRVLLRRENGDFITPLGWSPDGKRILTAFFGKGPQNLKKEIAFVSAKDGSMDVIQSADGAVGSGMSLSPDGRYIACGAPAEGETGQRDIFLLPTNGSGEFPLIRHPADEYSPIWSLDGRHVLFISDREGKPGVWTVDVVDGKSEGAPKLVKADIGQFAKWMGLTPEGACYYAIKTQREDIYIADFNPSSLDVIGKFEALAGRFVGSNSGPAWSYDGKYLAYFRHDWENRAKPGASTIIIRSMESGEERELSNTLNQPDAIQWFADGNSLLVSTFRSPKDRDYSIDFYCVDVKTGETHLLLQSKEKINTRRPGFSPDGKRIFFFCEKQPDETALISYNLESQEKKEVYLYGHKMTMRISVSLSPDGHRMAFVEDNGVWPPVFTVKVMGVRGENPKDLLSAQWPELINGQRALAWTPDGRYLLVVKMTFGSGDMPASSQPVLYKDELLLIPVEGGSIQKVNLIARELSSLSIHPNGNLVAFSALSANPPYEIWVMENFLPQEKKEKGGQR